MNAEDKQDSLDFIDFYVVLGIEHQKTLCKYLGISVRTIQRWRKNGTADKRKGSERKIPRKLKPEERRRIYQELCSSEYKDLNPNEIYNSLMDMHMQSGTFVRKTYVFLYRFFFKNSLREEGLQFSLNRFCHSSFFLRGLISCNRCVPARSQSPTPHRNLQPSTR